MQARARLRVPSPVIRSSPKPEELQLVGLPTWLWIDRGVWSPRSKPVAVPGVSVTVTDRPTRVVWTTGDGAQVSCDGPGTVWRPGMGARGASPSCGHTFRRPFEHVRVGAVIAWRVSWSGTGGGGRLPDLHSSASRGFRVGESQTLVTSDR